MYRLGKATVIKKRAEKATRTLVVSLRGSSKQKINAMNSTTLEAHPNTEHSNGSNEEDVNTNNNNNNSDNDDANSQEDNNNNIISKPTEEQLIERSVQVRTLQRMIPILFGAAILFSVSFGRSFDNNYYPLFISLS